MLDITYIREKTDAVKKGMTQKGEKDTSLVDQALELDTTWREEVTRLDRSRSELNQISGQIGELMKSGRKEEARG
jgi:Seryl-tRNA synthetase